MKACFLFLHRSHVTSREHKGIFSASSCLKHVDKEHIKKILIFLCPNNILYHALVSSVATGQLFMKHAIRI